MRFDRSVAFASAVQETTVIKQSDMSAPVVNQTGLLQGAGYKRHAGASHPEHLGQELLSKRDIIAVEQIATPEQPAA